ncbi:hypothetical protein ACVWYH_006187 [Bradyrhizobium sp. GM24.11]
MPASPIVRLSLSADLAGFTKIALASISKMWAATSSEVHPLFNQGPRMTICSLIADLVMRTEASTDVRH